MSIALEDIYRKVDEETAACVERKRNQPFFRFAWVRSRQSYEPACRSEVTAKYQADLTRAQQDRYSMESAAYDAAINPEPLNPDVIKIIIVALIAVVLIAWVLS